MDKSAVSVFPTRLSHLSLAVSLAVGGLALGWSSTPVEAACSVAGSTVTCTGGPPAVGLPSYSSDANNAVVNVQSGSTLSAPAGVLTPALALTGNNVTLNNAGRIAPSLTGVASLLSTGTVIGNANASALVVNNQASGQLLGAGGLLNASLVGLDGVALEVRNAAGGTTTLTNAGTIGSLPLVNLSVLSADTPVIAVTGGSQVNMTNTGLINGRAAFQASSAGNTFTNAGIINGSLSMGANSTNRFNLVSGSQVNAAGGLGLQLLVQNTPGLTYAATGTVDGGANGNNTLALRNAANGGAGLDGGGTVNAGTYVNFNRLIVDSGTWDLTGALLTGTTGTTLNGGLLRFDNALALGTGAVMVNGGALQSNVAGLSLANTVTVNSGVLAVGGTNDLRLNGVIAGTGGLTKTGSGLLTLGAVNTYTGPTTLAAGGLNLINPGAVNGTINVTGATSLQGDTAMTLGNAITLGGGSSLTLPGNAALTLGGAISGAGSLVKQGAAGLTLTGQNTFTGGTALNAGTLILDNNGALGTGALSVGGSAALGSTGVLNLGNAINLAGNTLTLLGAQATTLGGVIGGVGGALVKAGGADLTLTGSNTYSGGTRVAGGTLTVGGNNALGTGALTLADATNLNSAATVSLGNAINLGSSTLNLIGSNAMSLGGAISGTGGLVKSGAASLALNGASSFGGGVALNGGALSVGNETALGTGALTLGANASLDAGAALVVNNAVTLGGNTLTLPGSNALTLTGVIAGTGSLVKNGAAGLTLAGTNTFTGGTTLSAGTLTVGSDAALGTGALTLGGSAGLQAATAVNLSNAVALGSNSLTVSGANARLGGVISGSGNLIKSGSGNLILDQANTFSGGLTHNAGTLTLANAAALGTGALVVTGAATLDTTAPLTLANAVNLGANLSLAGTNDLSLNGVISGVGGLTKNGAGTLLLSGANSQQGTTVLNAGRLLLGNASALGSGSLNTAANTRLDSTLAGLALANAINLTGNFIVDGNNTLSFDGVVAGAGGLVKNGTAGLALQGANTFSGGVALNGGALVVGNAAALGSGTLTLGGNAGLSTNTDLTLGNAIALGGNTLTLGDSNALILGGVIDGAGSLIKTGPGGLTLAGANTFSGGVTLNQGPLAVANDLALGSGVLNLGSNAAVNATATVNLGNAIALNGNSLSLGGASAATLSGIISGAGGLSKIGPANLTLAGANTFTGGLTLNTGPLTLANTAALGTGALTVAGASTLAGAAGLSVGNAVVLNDALTVVSDGALALGGSLSGTGTLIKNGTGSLALSGNSTFSGGTTLNAGLLAVSDSAALGTGALQVNGNAGLRADAAVDLNNAIALGANALELTGAAAATLSGSIGGSGSLIKTGAGDLSLTAANTFTGGVGLNAGRLSVGNANALGSGTLTVGGTAALQVAPGLGALSLGNAIALDGNTLTLAGAADTTLTGTVGGTGGLAKVDSGNLLLAGSNTFSGGLTLASGTLTLANAAALGTGALSVTGAANLIGQGDLALSNALTLGAALTVDGTNALSLAGAVDGAGSLIKNGPGRLALGAANTFSGGVALNGGTLAVGNASALGSGGLSVNADAALDATTVVTLDNAIALNGGDLSITGDVFTALAGAVSGTGGLVKNGNDILQLNGVNTFAGGVTLNAGTVQLGNADALGTGTLALGGDAALTTSSDLALTNVIALGSNTLTLVGDQALVLNGPIQGSGALVKNGTATLALSGANAFSGGVALNAGTLLLGNDSALGSGTLTLSGSAALDATTALSLGNAIALQGNTLNVLGTQDLALTGTVSGGGGLTKDGLGNLTLASANSFTGGLTFNGGRLTVSDAAALGTGALTVTGAALLTTTQDLALDNTVTLGADLSVDGAQALTLNGPVNGGSGLIKLGTGSLTLAGANGFSGGVQLQAGSLGVADDAALGTGVLSVGGDAALVAITDVDLANAVLLNGSALTLTGSEDATLTGVISGTGALVKTGVGNVTLAGNNTFSGGLILNTGTLTLADAAALGSGALSVTGAASLANQGALAVANAIDLAIDLTLSGTDDLALTGDIGGAAGLVKTGLGTLTLGGDNTFAGGIALDAGTLVAGCAQALGTGALTLGGGATLDAATELQLNNAIALGGNILTLAGSNDLALQGVISGAGGLVKTGAADLGLGGANTFSGVLDVLGGSVTTLASGALGTAAGVNLGLGTQLNLGVSTGLASLTGGGTVNVGLGTALTLDAGALDNTFDGVLQGTGDLIKAGTGALTLTGGNVLTGTTTVASGLLNVIGSLASGNVQVSAGASLGGSGTLAGIVDVANGGRLIADAGVGLTLGGLTLNTGSILDIGLGVPNTGGPGVINVGGNLVLGGILNITDIGGFGTGLYHLIDYTGTLVDNGLTFGDLPGNVLPGDLEIQTAVAAQVNLLVGGAAGGVQFWDGSQTVANGAIDGGSGAWTNTATNWTDVNGTLNSAWGDTFAVFSGTPGTVTIEGLQAATGLQFVSDGYRLTGPGQLAMVNGGNGAFALRVNPDATATLDTTLVGVGQLAKLDSGTLVLNGTNLYTGGTRLQGGTLVLGSDAALGVGALVTARGTRLDSNQTVTLANAVQLEGPLTIAGSSALTLAGSVSGVGSLIKAGVDTLTLSGPNTFEGGINLNEGTLVVGSDTALGVGGLTIGGAVQLDTLANVVVGNAIDLGNNTLTLIGSNDTALNGAISGTGGLVKNGTTDLTLTGANTFTGGVNLNAGTLMAGSDNALGQGGLTLGGAAQLDARGPVALANGIDLAGNALTLLGSDALALNGTISGAGALIKTGAADLTLSGDNLFSAAIEVQGGSLTTVGSNALGETAGVDLNAGTALNLGASTAIALLTGAGNVNLGAGSALSIGNGDGDSLFGGALNGLGELVKAGAGNLTLTGISSLTGDTTVQAGTLDVSGSLASANVQVNDGANLTGTGTLLGSVTLADGAHLTANSGATLNTGALILNSGSILDFGLAAPTPIALVNANGNLTLDGTLNVTDLGGFGTGVYRLIDYTGTLIDNGLALGNIAGVVQPGDVQVQTVIASQVNLLVGALAGNVQFWDGAQTVANGNIDGGAGTWSNAGTNWTTVDGNINAAWGGGFAIFQGPAGQVTVDGTQAATGMQFVTDGYRLNGPGQLDTGTGSFAVRVDPNATATLDVGLTGAAQLTKLDSGTLVLNAANTYTGGTALQGGQLILGNAAALGDGALTAAADTALDTTQALTLANAISLGGNLNLLGNNDLQLDGVVSGAGSLSKLGAGNLVLSNANTFAGGLSLDAGTLTLAQAAALGTGTLTVSGAAALATRGTQALTNAVVLDAGLQLTGTDDLELAGPITGVGGLDKATTTTLVLSGANTFQGGTVLRGGQLIVGNDEALGQGGVLVAGASVLGSTADVAQLANAMDLQSNLTVIGDTGLALNGSLQGTGALTKAGAGNLTLNGANAYQGGTQLTAGRLTLGNQGALGSGALQVVADAAVANAAALLLGNTVNVADTATLTLDNAADLTLQGDLQGNGNLIKTGAAILALQGSKAFAGAVDVQVGTLITLGDNVLDAVASLNLASAAQLALGGNAQLAVLTGAGQVNLDSGSTLSLGGGVDNAFAGSFSGAGSLAKIGANTLTLSGDSALGGTTQVSQGTLRVDGNLGSAGILVTDGARLGGSGQIAAPVTVADGGRLLGESGQTLGLGSLNLAPGANLDIGLATPVTGGTPLFQVAGDLTLDGTVNVSDLGGFGNGVYRVIDYGGALTDNGLAFGNLPGSVAPGDLSMQTAIANQVNLLVGSPGLDIQFWDGSQVTGNGQVEGGAGVWNTGNTNWTDLNGQANAAWSGNFGVFQGTGGDVTVDGVQALGGVQFVVDGYRLLSGAAGALELVAGNTGGTAMRVDRDATAVLDVLLTGASRLIKLDTGTLVLNGANEYSGGTLLSGGTLVLGNDTAVGSGTLQTAANTQLDSNRAVNLANALTLDGPLRVLGGQNLALNGNLQGPGVLIKQGSADLTLAGTNDFAGGVSLEQGTLIVGSGAALGNGALTAAAGTALASSQAVTLGNAIALAGDLQVLGNEGLDLTGSLSGPGRVIKVGDGRLGLLNGNLFGGGVVLQAGTLVLDNDAALGSGRLDVTGNGNLDVTGPVQVSNGIALDGTLNVLGSDDLRLDGLLSGNGTLNKTGTADLTLTGDNTFSGVINLLTGSLSTVGPTALGLQSQLNVSLGALLNLDGSTVLGNIGGNGDIQIANGTQLNVEGGVFDGEIAGSGTLNKLGALRLALNGINRHSGITNVLAGSLWVDGSLASTTVNVTDGAVLGGSGTLGGTAAIADGGTLAVSGGQTLTVGSLLLGNAAVLAAGLGVPNGASPALVNVLGDLTLDGTLNITDVGGFGQGVYSLIDYAGTLTDNGLTLGSAPPTAGEMVVQTAVANQVNLVVTGDSNVLFWDGAQTTANGAIDGGSGVWTTASSNWTDANGTLNTPWNGSFAVFQAAPGVVTVDGQQAITGLQFSTDGYTLAGEGSLLTRADGTTNLRVDKGVTATLNVALEGPGNLTKYDGGMLVLNAASGYSGGTRLAGGTLVVGNDRALGTGALTAQANTTLDSNRAVTLGNALALEGTLALAGSNDLTLAGAVSGTGGLVKNGAGVLTLSGSNSYSGGTQVNAGRLQGDSASLQGTIANNAALTFAQALAGTFAGSLSGTGTLDKTGDGSLTLTGNNGLTGVTTVSAGTLQADGRLASTQVQVGSGARLAGSGTLDGAVQLAQGATLALVQSAAPLTLGSLALSSGSIVEASLGAPTAATSAAQVLGDLVLDGTLNVSDAGGFGRGVYQLFTYGGSLTDNGLALGTVPGGVALSDLSVQTAIARQVNLIVQAGPGGGGNEGGGNNGGGNEGGGNNGGGNEGGGNDGGGNEGGGNNGGGNEGGGNNGGGNEGGGNNGGGNEGGGNNGGGNEGGGNNGGGNEGGGNNGGGSEGGGNNGNGGSLQFWNGSKTVADGVIVGGDGVWGTATNWTTAQGNIAQSWGAGFGVFAGDAGTVTVNGTQSFTGLQVLTNGYQLVAGNDAALSPVNGNDGSLAPVRVNAGALANIAAPLVGEGGIDKRDAGTLILSGRNTYSGGTQISGGILIGDTDSLQGNIVNGATLAFQQAMQGVFNGILSGAGSTVKNGDGTLVMVGEHPTTGAFNVNQGVLQLGNVDTPIGVLGAQVSVAPGAALTGSGSVGSLVNRGLVQPGAGGLGIGGDFTNASSGTLAVDLAAAPDSYLNVGGTANLAGSLQVVNLVGGDGQYTVLTAGQGVQGTFIDTNLRNSPFLTSSLDYGANQVTLSVKRNAVRFSSLAATTNQAAVAQALESEGAPTPVVERVVALQAEEVPASFDALSGEIHASTAAVVMEDSRYVRDALNDRMRQPTCRPEDDPLRTLSPTNDQQLTSLGCQGEIVGWARALGGWGDFDGNGNHASVNRDLSGFMLGVDRALDDTWSVGVAAGHTRSSLDKHGRNSSATVKSYHLAAYLKYEMDAFAARMGAAYTWHDIETKRDLLVGGYDDRLKAKYKARTAQVFGEVGYAIDAGGVAVEPFAGLAYVNYDSDSAREKGGAGRLKAKVDQDVTYSTLGVRVGKRIVLDNGAEVTPRLSVGWRHAFGDTKPDADLRFLDGGDSFTVSGVPVAKDAAVVEAGLDVSIGERSKLGIGYFGQLSHQARDHGVSVSFSMGF